MHDMDALRTVRYGSGVATPSVLPLLEYDASRVQRLRQDYTDHNAAQILVIVHEAALTYSSRLTVSIELSAPPDMRGLWQYVAEISICPPRFNVPQWQPAPVLNLKAEFGEIFLRSRCQRTPQASMILVRPLWHRIRNRTLKLTFQLDNAFSALTGDGPLNTSLLGLRIRLATEQPVVLTLRHPVDYALRCRQDNSEYHSLSVGISQGSVQKLGFFPSSTVELRYLYGAHGDGHLYQLARGPLTASFGLFAGALTVAFDKSGNAALASTTLVFTLLPPIAQYAASARNFYRSADIRSRDVSTILNAVSAVVYIPLVAFALVTLTDAPGLRDVAQAMAYIAATILAMLAAALAFATREQAIPAHFCDSCGQHIRWRRHARLHLRSRRTLCRTCSLEIAEGA